MSDDRPTRVGVIGCGAIGQVVADALVEGHVPGAELTGIAVQRDRDLRVGVRMTVSELIDTSDVIVEAAGQEAFREFAVDVLAAGRDLVAVSVGALADKECFDAVASAGPGRLYLPSGAIGGADIVRAAAAMGEITSARITTTKLPGSLERPWMSDDERHRLRTATEPITLFDGLVVELVRRFPSSTNVAATLALAAGDWNLVRGVVRADPGAELTSHVIEVDSDAGQYRFEMRNQPSPQNPRSSAVVPWAVIRVLRDRCGRSWRVT